MKIKRKEYNQIPEVKERIRVYQREYQREYSKKYYSRPDVKAKKKEYYEKTKIKNNPNPTGKKG